MPRPTAFPLGACAAGGPLLSSACPRTAAAAFCAAPPLHPHDPAPNQRRLQTLEAKATWLPSGLASERPGPIASGQRAWWLAWGQVGEVQGLLLGWASALASPGLGLWDLLGLWLVLPHVLLLFLHLFNLGLQCLQFFLLTGKNVLFIYVHIYCS